MVIRTFNSVPICRGYEDSKFGVTSTETPCHRSATYETFTRQYRYGTSAIGVLKVQGWPKNRLTEVRNRSKL